MDKEEGFCTFKGYDFKGEDGMTVAQEDYLEALRQKLSVKLGRPVRRPSEIKRIGIYVRQVRERIRKERGFHGVRPH